ncbi:hypothetical protein HNR47_000871 [Methylopila jiangsuensis]|nr:hypothetical protein [Methylopila jiangsuensis]
MTYFRLRNGFFPEQQTIVRNEHRKILAIMDEGDLFPLKKDVSFLSDGCFIVE